MKSPSLSLFACGLSVIAAVAGSALQGAEIAWEAEDALSTTMSTEGSYRPLTVDAEAVLSGGAWLNGKYTAEAPPYAEYSVTVTTGGAYQLFVRKFWQHGPMRWRFDSDEWSTLANGKLLSLDQVAQYVPVNWVKLGEVTLTPGKHVMRVELVTVPDYAFNGSFGIDAFKLTTDTFLGESLAPASRK